MSRSDVILTIFAAMLVAFSLVVSLVVPRRRPGFPGKSLRVFALFAFLLVAAMLAAVEVFGEGHHFAEGHAEGGEASSPGDTGTTETTDTTETTETGGGETTTSGGEEAPAGDPDAGKQVFVAQNCGSCHTLAEAEASGQVGPNLDETLAGKDADFVRTSIVEPNAEVTEGFAPNVMPQNYGEQLSPKEIDDLVAFLLEASKS